MLQAKDVVQRALDHHVVIPAFNIPYLPMVKPVVQAVADMNSLAMVQVARVEWEKFGSVSLEAVAEEYAKHKNDRHTLLHLDHTPVIDEDMKRVDYLPIIQRALKAGYQSVMVDASRSNDGIFVHRKGYLNAKKSRRGVPLRYRGRGKANRRSKSQ